MASELQSIKTVLAKVKKSRNSFCKGCTENWSKEIFVTDSEIFVSDE